MPPGPSVTGRPPPGRPTPAGLALVRRHCRLAWSAVTGRPALIRQDPYARLACPDRPADLPGRATLSRRENLGFACYVWDPATAADAAGVVQGRRAGGRSAFLVLGVCPARAVSPAGPAPGARPPAGVRVGLRAAPPAGPARAAWWVRRRPRLGPRGRPDGCRRTPGWACDGAAGGPAGGPSDGRQAAPEWPASGSRVACGPRATRVAWGGPKLAYGARVRAARRAPRVGLAGPPRGPAGLPWTGLRAALWVVLAGRHPGWASGPYSGPLGRRARHPAPVPRMCRAFPAVSSCRIHGAGRSPPRGPAPAPGGPELALTTTGRGAAGR